MSRRGPGNGGNRVFDLGSAHSAAAARHPARDSAVSIDRLDRRGAGSGGDRIAVLDYRAATVVRPNRHFPRAVPGRDAGGIPPVVQGRGGRDAGRPLSPEVLQNLPNETLQLRGDQEEVEVAEAFETPFSQKMAEDAARMKVPAGPIAKPEVTLPRSRRPSPNSTSHFAPRRPR